MTSIRYHGPASEGIDVVLDDGDVLHMARLTEHDIPTELARSLLEQPDNFERPPRKAAKARGGQVAQGEPSQVGESGPELINEPTVTAVDDTNEES